MNAEFRSIPGGYMKDRIGNDIRAGSRVVYAVTSGRSPLLRVGIILGFEPNPEFRDDRWQTSIWSQGQHRILVEPDEDEAGTTKKVRLSFPKRLVVIG